MNRREFLEVSGPMALASASIPGRKGRGVAAVLTSAFAGTVPADKEAASQADEVRGVKGPFRVIDDHAHTLNTSVISSSPQLKQIKARYGHLRADGEIETLLGKMDAAGVGQAFLLTYSAEDLAAEVRHEEDAIGVDPVLLKPVINRAYQIKMWQAHRDRFWLFVNHSNPLRESFLEDLERDFDQGAVGWKYMPLFYGFLAENRGYWPAYELCRRRRCPVIVDLSNWHIGRYPLYNEVKTRQKLVSSFQDYAKLLDPLFREFRDVPVCLAHVGTPKDDRDYEAVFEFLGRHPNALIDTSPMMARSAEDYRRLAKAVGARKIMWGTDWPFGDLQSWRVIQDKCDFLSEEEKTFILAGNALRFVQGKV